MSKLTEIVDDIIVATNSNKTSIATETTTRTTHLSVPTAYHIYNGNLALESTTPTNGFSTTLYTGNGTTQTVNTGVDMDTQWGNDNSERYGGLVWLKDRSSTNINALFDTIRGTIKEISSNTTDSQFNNGDFTAFNNNGFSLANTASTPYRLNYNSTTYASWNFQTTHRRTGTTNHGKAFTEHYNPYTGFTIIKYTGSGIAGHEIPHSLGRKLGFVTVKNLSSAINWVSQYRENSLIKINTTEAEVSTTTVISNFTDNNCIVSTASDVNGSGNQIIMYGWADSYFDEANTLIGNFLTTVDGNGILRLSVHDNISQSNIVWQMSKATLTTSDWDIVDYTRGNTKELNANSSVAESTITANSLVNTVSPAKYPKPSDSPVLNLNATVPLSNGIDDNGSKVSLKVLNETVTGVTLTAGKNYVYRTDSGYGVSTVAPSFGKDNPLAGDFLNLTNYKWYNSSNVEISSRNYLDAIVYADGTGNATYVEQLPKTTYFDEIKANEYKGKNACTAWVNFNGTTTPPTIRDSYNVSSVVRTATGFYDIYFATPMNNVNYVIDVSAIRTGAQYNAYPKNNNTTTKCTVEYVAPDVAQSNNPAVYNTTIFGGKDNG